MRRSTDDLEHVAVLLGAGGGIGHDDGANRWWKRGHEWTQKHVCTVEPGKQDEGCAHAHSLGRPWVQWGEPPGEERQDLVPSGQGWLAWWMGWAVTTLWGHATTCSKNGGVLRLAALSGRTRPTKRSPSALA